MKHPVGVFAAWVVAGVVGQVLLTIVVALAFGARPVTVLSGSMEPAISPDDVLIERKVDPVEVHVGDVITFREPQTGRLLTHRVRRAEHQGSSVAFITKGDANNTLEHWQIPTYGEISRPLMRIPRLGYLARVARTPLGLSILILIPLLCLGGWEIYRTWRPEGRLRRKALAR